jgi:predicted KAP-like P-loop ATPase
MLTPYIFTTALDDLREEDSSFRIVVFIDDLDRCSPEKALEVLESIKSFFDIEGIIYLIGMNDTSIDTLIEKKYGKDAHKKITCHIQIYSWNVFCCPV